MDAPPNSSDDSTLRAYVERIGRALAYEKQYGSLEARLTEEHGINWRIMRVAMSDRFHASLDDIEERWSFERFHKAYVTLCIIGAREAFGG